MLLVPAIPCMGSKMKIYSPLYQETAVPLSAVLLAVAVVAVAVAAAAAVVAVRQLLILRMFLEIHPVPR